MIVVRGVSKPDFKVIRPSKARTSGTIKNTMGKWEAIVKISKAGRQERQDQSQRQGVRRLVLRCWNTMGFSSLEEKVPTGANTLSVSRGASAQFLLAL